MFRYIESETTDPEVRMRIGQRAAAKAEIAACPGEPRLRFRGPLLLALCFTGMIIGLTETSKADYALRGSPEATVCRGLVIEYCSMYDVVGVDLGGRTVPFPSSFTDVSDYDSGNGLCWLSPSNVLVLRGDDGKPFTSEADYVVFKCQPR